VDSEDILPVLPRIQPFLPIHINRRMIVESTGCESTQDFGNVKENEVFVALWVDDNYYDERPEDTRQKFWIAKVTNIIDDTKFSIIYYQIDDIKKDPFIDHAKWFVWNDVAAQVDADVSQVIIYGNLMTNSHTLRKKFLTKIGNKIEEDSMINF
jgi:hypothetical protein